MCFKLLKNSNGQKYLITSIQLIQNKTISILNLKIIVVKNENKISTLQLIDINIPIDPKQIVIIDPDYEEDN